jgi:hypothetical protein
MIFLTDDVLKLRDNLEERIGAGKLSEAEAYREALAADPDDPRALRLLALLAEEEGDFAAAASLAWRWLPADPLSHEAFRLIGRLLARDPAQSARSAAYLALGKEKLHFDPEAEKEAADEEQSPAAPAEEPADVAREMEPHRLLHTMWTASTGEIEHDVIERVIARGAAMQPLLLGVLNLWGEDLLDDVDEALVARSLVLLGECGGASAIGTVANFLSTDDSTLRDAASWALQRFAARYPVETLDAVAARVAGADIYDLAATAQHLPQLPAGPERDAIAAAITARAGSFDDEENGALAASLIMAGYLMEGAASPLAAAMEREYGKHVPREMRAGLADLKQHVSEQGPYQPGDDVHSVYEVCCPGFEVIEEDEPHVRSGPKIGRNDPCWCGSGKKYKKCHLAADEAH